MRLYPHQEEALRLTNGKNRVAYYYDMGLGKTYIGSEKMVELNANINLVICQKSKIQDWVNHFRENYEWIDDILDITKKKAFELFTGLLKTKVYPPKYICVAIINYDLVWRRPELLKLAHFTLMLDESSLISNRTAKRSKFALEFNPDNVILLSGTPTAGKYENLWSQLKLLGWNITEDAFFRSYVEYEWLETADGYWDKHIIGYKNIDHMKKKLAKYGAIFKKTNEVIDLPEQIEQKIYVPASKDYRFFVKHSYIKIGEKELIGENSLTKILYERELCGQYCTDKLDAFKDLLESTEDRLIVFYNFNDEMFNMAHICSVAGKPISYINGKVKDLKAYEEKDNSVTLIQYQAGAYGLNLQKANKIIYYSLPLGLGSCDIWEQSKKRIHRIGQSKTCFYYYLLVSGSIETWNLDLLYKGKELTDDLFKQERDV